MKTEIKNWAYIWVAYTLDRHTFGLIFVLVRDYYEKGLHQE